MRRPDSEIRCDDGARRAQTRRRPKESCPVDYTAHKATNGAKKTSAPAASPGRQVIQIGAQADGSTQPAEVRVTTTREWR